MEINPTASEKSTKLKPLIDLYITDGTFLWDEQTQNEFRALYYTLFLENFGKSRKCWNNSIVRVYKELQK